MKGICWRKGIEEAVEEISGGTRLLLLFFHRPDCEGSKKTIDEVLMDRSVIDMIERETAPVMINATESVDLAKRYRVDWTPTFVIADESGNELEQWVGYLPTKDFMAQMTLSKGLAAFHLGRFQEAVREFEMLIEDYPDSEFVPEAEYFLGVAGFKESGESDRLFRACHTLIDKYPDSQWTKRCSPWSHMITESRRLFVGYDGGGGPGTY
jgi:tetratricopeptide (TPR) repeat protein